MQIHINRDGEQYGPYPREQVESMLAQGQLLPTDMAWHEGMAGWESLGEVMGTAESPGVALAPVPEMAGAAAVGGGDWSIGGCVSDGFDSFKTNIGGCVVFALVSMIILAIAGFIPGLNIFILGPLIGGFHLFFIRQIRGEVCGFGDLFQGFSRNYLHLLLLPIAIGIISLVAMLPGILTIVLGATGFVEGLWDALKQANETKGLAPLFTLIKASFGVVMAGIFLMVVGNAFVMTRFSFAFWLVVDKRMSFSDAMGVSSNKVSGQFWKVFGLVFVAQLIGGLGQIAFGIGVLFTLPICWCAMAAMYVRNFD
ncbi:MAG: hypothetical protein CMO74_04675 [Verrucomicrobiales bacterium]|nr:hypothetical protein [Verrucomicrobiales bacterium]|tara:strand:+ start:289 stop:1221 length:933 start_codon:yes stop_codon:yes gene_type:complete